MLQVALIAVSYLLGAIPFGLIVGKVFRGIDIRELGSGNIGATNVLRNLGPGLATVVFFGDTLKGVAATVLARVLFPGTDQWIWVIAAGLISVIGHTASPFLKFKGGKGVATSLGMIIGMNWLIALIGFTIWVTLVAVTRYVSIASIIAPFTVPIMMYFSFPTSQLLHQTVPVGYTICSLVASLLILVRHKSNIGRLLAGTEPKFGQKK